MKTKLYFVITLLAFFALIILPKGFAQEPLLQPRVRLIYFLPKDRSDRPERKVALQELIVDTQEAFAYQMEGYGFGRKTFALETNKEGKPVVHHVNGKFNEAHYAKGVSAKVLREIDEQFDRSKDFYFIAIDVSHHKINREGEPVVHIDGFICGYGSMTNGHSGWALIPAWGHCFDVTLAAHELAHTFGLHHDARVNAKYIVPPGQPLHWNYSLCAAEWFDVHRAFNRSQTPINQPSTIEMLSPTLVSAPNVIRLRFKVTDPDGIHRVHLKKHEPSDTFLIGCNSLEGTHSGIVEFVTDYLEPQTDYVELYVMDGHGNIERSQPYPIDITDLLPRAKVVSIPDVKLASAVRREIGNSITTHTILDLDIVFADEVADLTGLEHARGLRGLYLDNNRISDFSVLARLPKLFTFVGNVPDVSVLPDLPYVGSLGIKVSSVSDLSTLSRFPRLVWLYLERSNISDISSLSGLTGLELINLNGNNVSDISALSGLTKLNKLLLENNNISDVSSLSSLTELTELNVRGNPLSYAAIHIHIPAMQARGVDVKFNKRTHPALVKISGDGQVAEAGTTLENPFVVEAVNGQGKRMKGTRVTFTIPSGDGSLSPTTAMTDAKGRARTTLKLGSTPGMNTVTVTAKGIRSSVTFTAHATGPPIYWIDTAAGTLHRLIGPEVENLAPGFRNATSLAIDMTTGKLYWTERTSDRIGKIRRSNLDGTNVQLVKNLTSAPQGITVDAAGGKIYLTNAWGKVQRMNFNGSSFQPNLITGLESPRNIAVDVAGGKLYWTEQTGNTTGKIRRANLDGSNVQLVKALTSAPHGLALDTKNRKIYLTNAWGKVQRMNFDGSNFQPNLIAGLQSPREVAVDVAGGKLYWAERGSLRCADLNGSNIQDVVTGLAAPANIALEIVQTDVAIAAAPAIIRVVPHETVLHANYPNPFNPETWIPYHLAKPADVTLRIYATDGRLVRTLELGHQPVGNYESRSRAAYWDGRNALDEPVASGVYFYTLSAGDFTATRKMLIQK